MPTLKKQLTGARALFWLCLFAAPAAVAQEQAAQPEPLLDRNLFSLGVGVSDNESNDSKGKTGFQFFVAYDLADVNLMEGVNSSAEFGFMDYGFSRDDTGIWASYVIDGTLGENLGWMAQVGYDFGDDSGPLAGAGLWFRAGESIDLRTEFVARDEVDSLKFNLLYKL